MEKSAFNKPIIGEINFPYSNIKTHLYFTSSIKKPVKIISEEKNQNGVNMIENNNSNNSLFNNLSSNDFTQLQNCTNVFKNNNGNISQ